VAVVDTKRVAVVGGAFVNLGMAWH